MPWEKQFNVDEALAAAQQTFWEQGYEATSMQQLLDRMGINRGSFYDTFNSKHDLLIKSLAHYAEHRAEHLAELAEGKTARQTIAAMLDCALKECRSRTAHQGCFVVNCALELAPSDPEVAKLTSAALQGMESFVRDQIQRAIDESDANPKINPPETARALIAMMLGMRVLSRAGSPKACLDPIPAQALALLD